MKKLIRLVLKNTLGILSKKTINKNNTEIILVTGLTGTSIARELIYNILKSDFNIRRNTKEVWWDFSVPLCILGHEDKQRNIFKWVCLIFRVVYRLAVKPSYHHKIIINIDTSIEETAKFWSRYIHPNIVVITRENPKGKLLESLLEKEKGKGILFVYNPEFFKGLDKREIRSFVYGERNSNLIYKKKNGSISLNYKKEKVNIKISNSLKFLWELIPPAIAVGILKGSSLEDLMKKLSDFTLHPQQIKAAITQLKEFVHSNEKEK